MLKNLLICLLFLALVGVSLFASLQERRINEGGEAARIAKEAKELAEAQEKQARNDLNLTRDSLETMGIVLVNAHADVSKAHAETKKAKDEAKKVVFTVLRSDKERDSVLKKLYPSLN